MNLSPKKHEMFIATCSATVRVVNGWCMEYPRQWLAWLLLLSPLDRIRPSLSQECRLTALRFEPTNSSAPQECRSKYGMIPSHSAQVIETPCGRAPLPPQPSTAYATG